MADRSIREVSRASGTTSRTLRHYEQVGVLAPSWVGNGGVRYYDDDALVRLQEALVLRRLGMPLAEVREVLDGERDRLAALRRHLDALHSEQQRLTRMAASVQRTIEVLRTGGALVTQDMFDGFDHTQHKDEVEERWGKDAYASGDAWWRGMTDDERAGWKTRAAQLGADWAAAADAGVAPDSDRAQGLARRHAEWLAAVPGTPGHGRVPDTAYLLGLADMYVADPRFAASNGGDDGARLVRDALHAYVGNR